MLSAIQGGEVVAEKSAIIEDTKECGIAGPEVEAAGGCGIVGQEGEASSSEATTKRRPALEAAKKKRARRKPRSRPARKKPASTATKQTTSAKKRRAHQPQLTILMPGDPGYDDDPDTEPCTLLDSEFAESSDATQAEAVLTQSEIVDLLHAMENSRTAKTQHLKVLTKLGKALDAGGEWLRVEPEGKKIRRMSVREYLIASLLHIRDKHGRLRELYLTQAQKDYQRHCGKRSIILKARQLGMTTYVAARFFVNCITRPGTLAVQVAHDQRSAEEIFRIVHRMLENLPQRFRKGALKTSRANVRQIVFPELDSEYRVETAADPNAGRGLTIQNLHCSEVARWPRDIAETLASLRAAVPPDGEIVLESTPDGAWGPFYEEWQHAAETGYTRHFYPWWWEPNYRRKDGATNFSEAEQELVDKHNLTPEQIAFRREVRANFGPRAPAEYAEDPEKCFLVSGECFFDVDIVQQRFGRVPDPVQSSDLERYLQWMPPVCGELGVGAKEYIIGADPAGGGIQGDFSCAQVIERQTGIQCAEYRGHLPPVEFAARLAMMAREYNNAVIAVERNNHGVAVLVALHMNSDYHHLYRNNGQDGWLTTKITRSYMLESLREMLVNHPDVFKSKRLLQECRTFVRHPDGTCAAGSGAHDDTVMAMAIAQVVRSEMPKLPIGLRPVGGSRAQPSRMFAEHEGV